ncbi:hypothetical protein FBUS_06841 [Fasciolopsis buskii]|uniref:Phosphofurin acidic cluster sorting protein 1/2 N-terminal C2 domain-containing protein n=1 Tax=Fasciolopsis buskii TaxID=27845 RepID=A0A8E0RSZ5_9TREM|nr:hypothetical protein FBUS_06841 [Fasciolopsis buski]
MISMKMSASWEAEKSSANAVPRLCNLSLVQIILDRPLEPDSTNTGFFVVVRMAGSARRVLRSPEITLIPSKLLGQVNGVHASCTPPTGQPPPYVTESAVGATYPTAPASNTAYPQGTALTTPVNNSLVGELAGSGAGGSVSMDFNCSIQYSHVLNRDGNTLQILIQRRKKYKSKTMNLGYKTLAYCNVNLAQVLQRRIENRFLDLYTDPKCSTHPVGRVEVQCLSTSPVEKDLMNGKRKGIIITFKLNHI